MFAMEKKSFIYKEHPIIRQIFIAFVSVFILIGASSVLRGCLQIIDSQDASRLEVSMWMTCIIFIAHSLLFAYDIYANRRSKIQLFTSAGSFLIFFVLGIVGFFFVGNLTFLNVALCIYYFTQGARRILTFLSKRTKRAFIFYGVLAFLFFVLFATSCFENEALFIAYLLFGFIEIGISLGTIVSYSFKSLRFGILLKIIKKTYAAEIFVGMFTMMIAFSFALYDFEPEFQSYGDALWYCFTTITTIGYGDYAVKSVIGRILLVILGTYGIVVVAVITSIIVNFYTETKELSEEKKSKEEGKPQIEASPVKEDPSPEKETIVLENQQKQE